MLPRALSAAAAVLLFPFLAPVAAGGDGQPAFGSAACEPTPYRPLGWLGDGTGVYPGAAPPVRWNVETGENIVWKTRLRGWHDWPGSSWEMWFSLQRGDVPAWGNSQPVVARGKVFLTHDPEYLVCLDADTGELLWRTRISKVPALPEKQRTRARQLQAEVERLNAVWLPIREEVEKLERRVKENPEDAELKARLKERMAAMHEPMAEAHGIFFGELGQYTGLKGVPWKTLQGYAFPTPVTDGRRVYVKFATGCVAAVDLDGNILWRRAFRWNGGPINVTSPCLAEGKLVVTFHSPKSKKKDPRLDAFALDASTGETVWKAEALPAGTGSPSPVHLRLGRGDEALDVVVLSGGDVVRLRDGRVVAEGIGDFHWGTPSCHGQTVYFFTHKKKDSGVVAVRLQAEGADRVRAEKRWHAKFQGNPYNAVLCDGDYAYCYVDSPRGGGPLMVIDDETGEILRRTPPITPRKGEVASTPVYGNPLIADDRLYVFDQKQARFAVLEPGPDGKVLGRMGPMGKTTSSPVAHGDRLYLRTHEWIYCIGPSEAD